MATTEPILMGTKRVWSWIDSYSDIIDYYTANGWKSGGEWYFIRLKSGQWLYGFDGEDNGGCCLTHGQWVDYDGWDVTDYAPEFYSYLSNVARAAGNGGKYPMCESWLKDIIKPLGFAR
jgi:hypothetical protein